MLLNYLLNDDEGTAIMASERGIPLSAAALANCTSKGLLDATVAEANAKILSWCQFSLDPKFEDSSLKSSDGAYYDAVSGLSYDEYTSDQAADVLINGINAAYGN